MMNIRSFITGNILKKTTYLQLQLCADELQVFSPKTVVCLNSVHHNCQFLFAVVHQIVTLSPIYHCNLVLFNSTAIVPLLHLHNFTHSLLLWFRNVSRRQLELGFYWVFNYMHQSAVVLKSDICHIDFPSGSELKFGKWNIIPLSLSLKYITLISFLLALDTTR